MPSSAVLQEIRLPAFKSVREAVLPLRDLTLVVGRNGSGKSNVLDGLWVLSRLAAGGDIRDQLDGGRDGPAIRGGAEGCAPLGSDRFSLGCSVGTAEGTYHLDVEVCVAPAVQVARERLSFEPHSPGAPIRTLLETEPADLSSPDITARWDHQEPGPGPFVAFRASHLLTSQVASRVPATTQAGRDVHRAASLVLRAMGGVFVLDPVPHAMRRYVPAGDHRLRRQADNLSAVVGRLLEDQAVAGRLLDLVRSLSESRITSITTERSGLGDVMLAQHEVVGGEEARVPARLMSDGTLRVLAILAAVLEGSVDAAPAGDLDDDAATTLVIEEIENGLHPSQAALMVRTVREESEAQGMRTLATTHSPAMLDALPGSDHAGVAICVRDEEGWTRLHRLTELPNYASVVAGGTIGDAALRNRLRPVSSQRTAAEVVAELFGEP